MNSTIRAFIAVDVSPAIRSQAQKAVKPLQNAFPDVKWVDDENFHVTLKFLGPNVPTTELHLLIAAIERACKGVEQFDLVFEGLGAFPDSSNPRSIWIGVSDGIDEIRNLAARIDNELEALGYPVEGREFRPHLTIGRSRKKDRNVKVKLSQDATIRNAKTSENASLADMLSERSDLYLGTSPVDNVVLYSSDLQRNGPQYEPLAVVDLDPLGSTESEGEETEAKASTPPKYDVDDFQVDEDEVGKHLPETPKAKFDVDALDDGLEDELRTICGDNFLKRDQKKKSQSKSVPNAGKPSFKALKKQLDDVLPELDSVDFSELDSLINDNNKGRKRSK
ncbi:MAG: RNA 2',3'-cyclic phosphodiesterase [Thermoguttaceae bacterium]